MTIQKILIANRGEIALRVIRTAKEMGIKTVAIYSDVDRNSLHVRYADEAVWIGGIVSQDSYLRKEKIIEACKKTKADAVHPGYGFLSENADFAQMLQDNSIIFIGPSAASIRSMGDKLSAKKTVSQYNIPMVPGINRSIHNLEAVKKELEQIGYPILIKASAGGGGKGMRVVEKESDFESQYSLAVSEAKSSFGDGTVFIEKYIHSPKHVEVQILGDQHGNILYFFERDCSIQRRHQKLIEEAPCPILTPAIRRKIGETAVQVAKACNYYGAGTVEFIMDEQLNFFFLEMNTRLQVEHPVTEMITGIDLVRQQILIAEKKKMSIQQADLEIRGHAIEVRICAEDPLQNFLPDIGRLEVYKIPQGTGVRVDDGYEQGMLIPQYYDNMIAKLIVHAENRELAIQKMLRAIDDYKITGIAHTLSFCKFALQHPEFISGKFDTKFINKYFTPKMLDSEYTKNLGEIAATVAFLLHEKNKNTSIPVSNPSHNWKKRSK
ncbi:MAG: acetyl-CoA carboxylase biotin carboxylase subunit [Chitinophagaceae bacterium]|nr:acetyl-CoA carboxylase biotin carboxylase subunit [Chitinophagaceae bacterium]